MATYRVEIEVPAAEFALLNSFMASPVCMGREDLNRIQQGCELAWNWGFNEGDAYLDMLLSAQFEDGKIMDLWIAREVDEPKGGYFNGIQFGDKESLYIQPGERKRDCYPIYNTPEDTIAGTYTVFHKGNLYQTIVSCA